MKVMDVLSPTIPENCSFVCALMHIQSPRSENQFQSNADRGQDASLDSRKHCRAHAWLFSYWVHTTGVMQQHASQKGS